MWRQQAAVFLEQMEQAADSARQSAIAGAQDNFGNSMPGMPDASSGIQPGQADSASGKSTDETYVPSADDEYYVKKSRMRFAMTSLTAWSGRSVI